MGRLASFIGTLSYSYDYFLSGRPDRARLRAKRNRTEYGEDNPDRTKVLVMNYLSYTPYSTQPSYLWENLPIYITGACMTYGVGYLSRKSYVMIMKRYIKY